MADAQAVPETPHDTANDAQPKVPFWDRVTNTINGIGGAVDAVQGVTESTSAIAGDIADAKTAINDANHREDAQDQDLFLDRFKVLRGDNKHAMIVAGVAAVAVIVIFSR